jgi:hypothetical protein
MILKEVYPRYWYWPYTFREVRDIVEGERTSAL